MGSPSLVDWLALLLRWLAVVGISASIILGQFGSPYLVGVLLAESAWTAGLSLLVYLARPLGEIRYPILISDFIFALLLNLLAGIGGGSMVWAGILPVFTAAFFLEIRGLALVVLAVLLVLGGQGFIFTEPLDALATSGLAGLAFAASGAAVYLIRRRILRQEQAWAEEMNRYHLEAERIGAERQKAIYKLVSTLSATLNYERVLDTALDICATALAPSTGPAEPLISAVLLYSDNDESGPRLQVGSARRFTPADLRIALEGRQGLLGKAIDEAESMVSTDISSDPELNHIVALRGCRSAFCVPLRTGLDTYGVMLFAHQQEGYFTDERREVLDIIGSQATIAIQNARLYRDLELEKERMLEIQEEARVKLARDLHDGPTQSVAALAMRVNFARRMMDRDKKVAIEELVKIEDLARRTTQEIRHMLFTLRPLVLESQGLSAALEAMAIKMKDTYNQEVLIAVDEKVIDRIEMSKQSVIFFIAEEAVNNARKHARAEHVWVNLRQVDEDLVLLEIKDDGVGFDPEAVSQSYDRRDSLGMVNMRERAQLVNGVLHISSAEGRGTRVQVAIPLTEAAADRLNRRKGG
jgi:signal transduction histidine kinase